MTAAPAANSPPHAASDASDAALTRMSAGIMAFTDDPPPQQQVMESTVSGPDPSLAHTRASASLQRIHSGASELLRFSMTLPENYGQTHDATSDSLIKGPMGTSALQAMAQLSDDIALSVGEIAALSGNSVEPNMEKRKNLHDDQEPEPRSHKASSRRRQKNVANVSCHTCHRVETPQWRSGPDGPGTLCNVCGLVYAKRERMKQPGAGSSQRPS